MIDEEILLVWETSVPSNKNRTRYQRAKLLSTEYRCHAYVVGTIASDIESRFASTHVFPQTRILRPLFLPWVLILMTKHRFLDRNTIERIHTSPHSIAIIISMILKQFGVVWIQDIWDDPLLSVQIQRNKNDFISKVGRKYNKILYYLAKENIESADLIILGLHEGILDEMDIQTKNICSVTNGYSRVSPEKYRELSSPSIVYVGEIMSQRHIPELIESLGIVIKDFPDIELNLIGPFGDDREEIETLIESIGIKDNVRITGKIEHSEALKYIARSDIGVSLLSNDVRNYRYSYPIKTLEYMSLDSQIIVTETPATCELLEPNTVFLSENTPEEIAAAIRELLNEDRNNNFSWGSKMEEYSWEFINQKIIKCLSTLESDPY